MAQPYQYFSNERPMALTGLSAVSAPMFRPCLFEFPTPSSPDVARVLMSCES
jgi:hypothetical protein